MIIVLDTNVIVSGFLSAHHPSGNIVQMVAEGLLKLCYDGRILMEYREVLLRQKFGFDFRAVTGFLIQIKADGILVGPRPPEKSLPDPTDNPFLEAALAGQVECLVTGNRKHFPKSHCHGVLVVSPSEFLQHVGSKKRSGPFKA